MVWFQCEDCGESLKKPKLLNHFRGCSASKLSCIDCGVVFDQQSVQAHTLCVSETEKYGPKNLNKALSVGDIKISKGQNVSGGDLNIGLSTCAPWACSLCNVKTTSRETLEAHSQGKKHRSRARASALKDVVIPLKDVSANVAKVAETSVILLNHSDSIEKKRKKVDVCKSRDDSLVTQETKKAKKYRISKLETDGTVGTISEAARAENPGTARISTGKKKRKHTQEEQKSDIDNSLKCHKKDSASNANNTVSVENNGTVEEFDSLDVAEAKSGSSKKKGKDRKVMHKGGDLVANANMDVGQTVEDTSTESDRLLVEQDIVSEMPNGKADLERVNKKMEARTFSGVVQAGMESGENGQDNGEKSVKRRKHKKAKNLVIPTRGSEADEDVTKVKKEFPIHEVSFREWLEDPGAGGNGGTPTHPPMNGFKAKETPLDHHDKGHDPVTKDGTKSGVESTPGVCLSKLVKWKKLTRAALIKSPDGSMTKKDLKKAVLRLALKAVESAPTPIDGKALELELLRQINSSSKFVVNGKRVQLAAMVAGYRD